jgi:hypothetical protein
MKTNLCSTHIDQVEGEGWFGQKCSTTWLGFFHFPWMDVSFEKNQFFSNKIWGIKMSPGIFLDLKKNL